MRQKSILSFLLKPPPPSTKAPENDKPVVIRAPVAVPDEKPQLRNIAASIDEIRGTDTPPEKEQRSLFPVKSVSGGGETDGVNRNGHSLFSSIKHKFMKPNSAENKPSDRSSLDDKPANDNVKSSNYNCSHQKDKESSASVSTRMKNVINVEEINHEGDTIKSKFMRPNIVEKASDRNFLNGNHENVNMPSNIYSSSNGTDKESSAFGFPRMKNWINVDETTCEMYRGNRLHVDCDDDITGPETPGTRPLVPRLKRVQEDRCNFGSATTQSNNKRVKFSDALLAKNTKDELSSEMASRLVPPLKRVQEDRCNFGSATTQSHSKRVKFSDALLAKKTKDEMSSEMASKFDWLLPSKIKDANGRRPNNPLYDKRTLYIPPDVLKKMSASQKQYWSVKSQYMDVLIFFKVGKFYELYELDAEVGHKELDWKMTMSGVGKCRQVGITEYAIDDAIEKLLARGYKVGRVEQLETSEQAKSRGATAVIQRKLVHVLTPSTLMHGNIGPQAVHLFALKEGVRSGDDGTIAYGFAFVDCAALQFWVGSVIDDASCAALGALLMQVSPAEVIFESQGLSKEAQKALNKYSLMGSVASRMTPAQPATDFIDSSEARNFIQLKGYFKGSSNAWDCALDGVLHQDIALCALGGLTNHLSRLKLDDALRNGSILPYEVYKGCLRMDGQTMANLEIFSNTVDGGISGTLYKYLDNCVTSSGKRLLRKWLCQPLKDAEEINQRLNVVEELMGRAEIMALIPQYLRKLPDLERFLGQIKATFQSSALLLLPLIGNKILKQRVKAFGSLVKGLRAGMNLLMLLQKENDVFSLLLKIFTLPVISGNDGLDKFLTQFEAAVDSDFPNYQAHEIKDSDAETLSILIELFMERANEWFQIIVALNCTDVLRSFAITANFSCMAMCRPVIVPRSNSSCSNQASKGPTLHMKGLCHPYALGESGGTPVSNDLCLGDNDAGYNPRTMLLTGPNMGGKSTILRATCLAVVLAQLGCYVPCEMCVLSPVDIIFTRLGATDRIMTGESTFLIECTETASVLQNATQDSLVILDELGRGTSTFDGYAIAYAVFRHLVEKVNCRLLFATHYHPLTKEFALHPHVMLQHMACTFKSISNNSASTNQELVFLYRLTNGACPESYGMQVALMAGIPKKVVETAMKKAEVMKTKIRVSFQSSERRSEFSTLHEEWLKNISAITEVEAHKLEDGDEDDAFDTLVCLQHEIKCSNKKLR
uniref:DNA mismatch repair protein MSH7 n=1 Tax=Erigeron canadensis TaxID=72917 RepID=UPI001CB9AFB4|nr:DNA mismatch repair protein MSH7 [Erigeron canadensis]